MVVAGCVNGLVFRFTGGAHSMFGDADSKARRNRLLRCVSRPDPSTFTTYWSCGHFSIMVPVLSHRLGALPVWFWMKHLVPTSSCERFLACSLSFSEDLKNRVLSAASLEAQASLHAG